MLLCTAGGCNDAAAHLSVTDGLIPSVRAIPAEVVTEYSIPLTFYGRIEPRRRTSLAFEQAGSLTAVLVNEGEQVLPGQELATLDRESLVAERGVLRAHHSEEMAILSRLKKGERDEVLAASRAEVTRHEAEAEQSQRNFERVRKLRERETLTQADLEEAEFSYRSATAALEMSRQRLGEILAGTRDEDLLSQEHRVARMKAEIDRIEIKLKKSVLRAPYLASVVRRRVDEGAVVESGQPILDIEDAEDREARVAIPTASCEFLPQIDTVTTNKSRYRVQSYRITSRVSPSTRTVDVLFKLECSSADLPLSGAACEIGVLAKYSGQAVRLPVTSLVPSIRGLWSCYEIIADEPGTGLRAGTIATIAKRDVTVLHTTGDSAYVSSDLVDGAAVVAHGAHKIVPGMLIRIAEPHE